MLGLDAAPIIYFVEGHPVLYRRCVPFFAAISNRQIEVVVSTLIYAETLVHSLRNNDAATQTLYRNLLSATQGLTTLPVTIDIAEQAADLRARYNLATPDAIHLVTAIDAGCDAFLTNDASLQRVAEIRVLVLQQLTI